MDIRDIARLSGYGLGTVSRVLNDRPNVSDRARERVLAVVKEYGYEPNANARHLKRQARSGIAILVMGSQNALFADILERVQSELAARGEQGMAVYLDEDDDEAQAVGRLELERRPRGYLFLGGNPSPEAVVLRDLEVPAVVLTNSVSDARLPRFSSFTTDDERAGADMADLLVSAGHRRIGVLGGSLEPGHVSSRRLHGVCEALARRNVPFDPAVQHENCRFTLQGGYEAAQRLLNRAGDLTAIFALGDFVAIGARRAIHDRGLSVPEDISLAGFDGTDVVRFSVPRLTTVAQDTAALASLGVNALLARISDPTLAACHQTVPHHLLVQDSVRTIPGA